MKTKLIEDVLIENNNARNNDKVLILSVWERQGLILSDAQKDLFLLYLLSPETIRRKRQLLQEKGQYLPNKEVTENRYNLFKEVKQNIPFTENISLFKEGYE